MSSPRYRLAVLPEAFALQIRDGSSDQQPKKTLFISRDKGKQLRVRDHKPLSSDDPTVTVIDIYGCIGVFSLLSGIHLAVVIDAVSKGTIRGQIVYQIQKILLLPYDDEALREVLADLRRGKLNESKESKRVSKFILPDGIKLGSKKGDTIKGPSTSSSSSTLNKSSASSSSASLNSGRTERPVSMLFNDSALSKSADDRAKEHLHKLFERTGFYFSYTFDLTNTLNRQSKQRDKKSTAPLKLDTLLDERFWFNRHALAEFVAQSVESWALPLIQGFVHIQTCHIGDQHFDFILISRKSRYRAGLRYKKRGADLEGHVANYVETEQIIAYQTVLCSFVQIRGSIPLLWSQSSQALKPEVVLHGTEKENTPAMRRHFDEQFKHYGPVTCINLVDKTGREATIGGAFEQAIVRAKIPNITITSFDFHEACRNGKYANVSLLINKLQERIEAMLFHWETYPPSSNETAASDPIVLTHQFGIFRTNCMDCLDRTNLVQAAIARQVVSLMLMKIGITGTFQASSAENADFEREFNLIWASNGDAVSKAYAGTGALKGDYTRTGKRTNAGRVSDGVNSITRLYMNSFKDGLRQAAIDFVLGIHGAEIFKKKSEQGNQASRIEKLQDQAFLLCKNALLREGEKMLAAWILTGVQIIEEAERVSDQVVLVTNSCYYLVDFNFEYGEVVHAERVLFEDVLAIDLVGDSNNRATAGLCITFKDRPTDDEPAIAPSPSTEEKPLTLLVASKVYRSPSNDSLSIRNHSFRGDWNTLSRVRLLLNLTRGSDT